MRNLTPVADAVDKPRVGRKRLWFEQMQARFPAGTFERIRAILQPGELKMDFVRDAVMKEIQRRERQLRARKVREN